MSLATAVEIPTILIGVAGPASGAPRVHRPEDHGAVGDGTADDTEAWLRMRAALGSLDSIEGRTGAVYLIDPDAFTLPNTNENNVKNGMFVRGGTATLKARSAGQALIAFERWATNSAFSSSPWWFKNWRFDAADLADWCFVNRSYQSMFESCRFSRPSVNAFLFTRTSKDGSQVAGFQSTTKLLHCTLEAGTATSGALLKSDSANGVGPTDAWVEGCSFNGADVAPYGIDLLDTDGWIIVGNHTFGAGIADIYLRKIGKGGSIALNTIEDGMLIGSIKAARNAAVGPGNTHWRDVTVIFDDDDDFETLNIAGDTFAVDTSGTTDARIVHSSDRLFKRIISKGNTFRSSAPYVEQHANSVIIDAGGNWSGGLGNMLPVRNMNLVVDDGSDLVLNGGDIRIVEGLMRVLNGYLEVVRQGAAYVGEFKSDQPNPFVLFTNSSPVAGSDVFELRFGDGSISYHRRDVRAISVDPSAQSALVYDRVITAGESRLESALGNGMQLGTPTGGAKGTGTLNAQNGVYVDNIPVLSGNNSPEGVVTAPVGSVYLRKNGTAGATLWIKESGTENTGWVAK